MSTVVGKATAPPKSAPIPLYADMIKLKILSCKNIKD
jgi:hypothetical protein